MEQNHKEIERKWLIKKGKSFDLIQKANSFEIEQYYIIVNDDKEIRFRKISACKNSINFTYIMTIKMGKGLSRNETETEITQDIYESFKTLMKGHCIIKTRYYIYYYPTTHKITTHDFQDDDIKLEIDDYHTYIPFSTNYAIIEKEFENEEKAKKFEFLLSDNNIIESIHEITDKPCFKNKQIAIDGFTSIFSYISTNAIQWIQFGINNNHQKGLFIVFEGIDGSGKSTLLQLFQQQPIQLYGKNELFITTCEPTHIKWGKMFRDLCLTNNKSDPRIDCMLLALDRIEHSKEIEQLIKEGNHVISDRYVDSNVVYQSVYSNMSKNWIKMLNDNIIQPDLIFIFDVDPEEALKRIQTRNGDQNVKFEKLENLTKMRTEFLNLSELYFKTTYYIIINTTNKSIPDIYQEITNIIQNYVIHKN